jgi:hypothetical protein
VRCDVAAVRLLLGMTLLSPTVATGQQTLPVPARTATAAYDALLEGMACRQQKSGRMDCEFRVGSATRFVVAGVGQEDVTVSFVQADSAGEFVAGIVPLHGCIVVKPSNTGEATRLARIPVADSVTTFAFVSPKTGKVYRTWASCLSATKGESMRTDGRADSIQSAIAEKVVARQDSIRRADSVKAARRARPPR